MKGVFEALYYRGFTCGKGVNRRGKKLMDLREKTSWISVLFWRQNCEIITRVKKMHETNLCLHLYQRAAKISLPRGTIPFNKGCCRKATRHWTDKLCYFLTLLFYVKHTGLPSAAYSFMLWRHATKSSRNIAIFWRAGATFPCYSNVSLLWWEQGLAFVIEVNRSSR